MDFLWDTNLLIHKIRKSWSFEIWNNQHKFFDSGNRNFISIVSVGEISSIALQRNWGDKKMKILQNTLNQLSSLPIAKRNIIEAYSRIDAYSQGKLKGKLLPKKMTARNMGKNDLWIAATAKVINAKLVTTDKDFQHLNDTFFEVIELEFPLKDEF